MHIYTVMCMYLVDRHSYRSSSAERGIISPRTKSPLLLLASFPLSCSAAVVCVILLSVEGEGQASPTRREEAPTLEEGVDVPQSRDIRSFL